MNKATTLAFFTIFLLVLIVSSAGGISNESMGRGNKYTVASDLLGARVINSTNVYVNQPINLTTIIDNPTTWVLKNVSFEIKLGKDIKFIDALNTSNVETHVDESEEETTVRVNITIIPQNTKEVYWVVIKFTKEGDYTISESSVSFIKQKGELTEKGSITIPSITIKVSKKERQYPPEGSKDATIQILLVTILIPLIIIGIANKIAWKE